MKNKYVCLILSIVLLSCSIGCGNLKEIEYYPNDISVSKSGDEGNVENDVKNDTHSSQYIEYNSELLSIPISEEVNEEIQSIAVQILKCVDNCENEIVFDEEITQDKFNLGYELAMYSNPLVTNTYAIMEEPGKFSVSYLTVTDKDVLNEHEDFKNEINKMMQECRKEGDSSEDFAKNAYDYIIANYDYDQELEEKLHDPAAVLADDDDDDDDNTQGNAVSLVLTGKGTYDSFLELYMFLLNQMGIRNIIAGSSGVCNVEDDSVYHYLEMTKYRIYWDVVITEDNAYHCIMLWDLLMADTMKEEGSFDSFKSSYFGLSDETAKKYWTPYYIFTLGELVPGHSVELPPCENDYK